MATVNPYLNFNGNTEEAFNFYRSVFGGEFITLQRFKDTPESGNVPASEQNKIMHISLAVGKESYIMASDAPESMGFTVTVGNNMHISLNADSKQEADKLFNGLAAGGTITMPIENTFWGSYFGMLTDKFGINWMVSFENK